MAENIFAKKNQIIKIYFEDPFILQEKFRTEPSGENDQISDRKSQNIDAEAREAYKEQIKITVISASNTVSNLKHLNKFRKIRLQLFFTYPGTVMIESIDAVVADRAMRGSRRSKNFTSIAVFLFYDRTVDFCLAETRLKKFE